MTTTLVGLSSEVSEASARGWRLIPLHARGKTPLVKGWPDVATGDAEQLARWANQWPNCNWGVATGPTSGLMVLDVDSPDGNAALVQYEGRGLALPDTLTATTGRGRHHYFRWPRRRQIRNSAGALGNGLDVRGAGGYIVIPPSIHSTGVQYLYLDPNAPIVDAPEWLISSLTVETPLIVHDVSKGALEGGVREGKRNGTLASLAGAMRRNGMSQQAIEEALLAQNRGYAPPLSEHEVRAIAASVARYEPARCRRAATLCLADVEPEAVEWLWEPYIPLKMLTVFSGDPGVGKTALMMELAARLTRGDRMNDGKSCEPENVLYLTNENSPSHVLRPRFDALGGNPSRFFVLTGTIGGNSQPAGITLADTETLEDAIASRQIRMVVIDPLQSFLGAGVDAHRANETRPVMDGLIKLAERTGCAVLITRHLSKGVGGSSLYRGMGSIDITGAARCELLVARDPEDAGRVVMAHSKSNLGPLGASLTYSIGKDGLVTWCGESSHRADDLLTSPPTEEQRSARKDAQEFLRAALAAGPQPTGMIQQQAKASGISIATLRRAEKDLGLIKRPDSFGGAWTLALPTGAQSFPELFNAQA